MAGTSDHIDSEKTRILILLSADTGEKRKLASPSRGWIGDQNPAFSPDGRSLAFIRSKNPGESEIFVLALSDRVSPKRAPVRVTFSHNATASPSWTPDGTEIVFSSGVSDGSHWLWRLPIPVKGAPERSASLGDTAFQPAIAMQHRRLAYTKSSFRTNTWRMNLPSDGGKRSAGAAFIFYPS